MCVCRLGLQYGHRISVPRLASVRPGCGSPCNCFSGWTYLYAREPTFPPGGETVSIVFLCTPACKVYTCGKNIAGIVVNQFKRDDESVVGDHRDSSHSL